MQSTFDEEACNAKDVRERYCALTHDLFGNLKKKQVITLEDFLKIHTSSEFIESIESLELNGSDWVKDQPKTKENKPFYFVSLLGQSHRFYLYQGK